MSKQSSLLPEVPDTARGVSKKRHGKWALFSRYVGRYPWGNFTKWSKVRAYDTEEIAILNRDNMARKWNPPVNGKVEISWEFKVEYVE